MDAQNNKFYVNEWSRDQSDVDADGMGDACDSDMDGDLVPNDADNCPRLANADQSDNDLEFEKVATGDNPPNYLAGAQDLRAELLKNGWVASCESQAESPECADLLAARSRGGDACDLDDDNDGVPDDGNLNGSGLDRRCRSDSDTACDDNCPMIPNSSAALMKSFIDAGKFNLDEHLWGQVDVDFDR